MQREIRTAARWWADQIRNSTKFDNGADSKAAELSAVFAVLNRERAVQDVTPEMIDLFELNLEMVIATRLSEGRKEIIFGVDYDPDQQLRDALATSIPDGAGALPWKTYTHIQEGKVTLKHGYGADWVELPLIEVE